MSAEEKASAAEVDVDLRTADSRRPLRARRIALIGILFALGVAGASVAAWAETRPQSPSWVSQQHKFSQGAVDQGLFQPGTASPDGQTLTQSVNAPDPSGGEGSVVLTYSATLVDGAKDKVVALDYDPDVTDVGCGFGDAKLHLKLHLAAGRRLRVGTLVTGSHFWGCSERDLDPLNSTNSSNHPGTIMHRVTAVHPCLFGGDVAVELEPAAFGDLFKSLDVTYHNSLVNHSSTTPDGPLAVAPGRRLSWFSHAKDKVEHAVHSVGDDAKDVVHLVTHHGDFSAGSTKMLKKFTWSPPTSTSVGPLSLAGSHAEASLGTKFSLQLHDYSLQSAEIALVANADIKAAVSGSHSLLSASHTFTASPLPKTSLGSVAFMIGPVPIYASASASLELEATLSIHENLHLGGYAQLSSSATYGVQYSGGSWHKVETTPHLTPSYQMPTLTATSTAEARLSVNPSFSLSIDKIATATAKVVPYLDAKLRFSDSASVGGSGVQSGTSCTPSQMSADVDWGVGVDVSAHVGFKLPKLDGIGTKIDHMLDKTLGPYQVVSDGPHSLLKTCITP